MTRSVLIIGGGPAGLTGGLRLSLRGFAVTLLEQGADLGGRLIRAGPASSTGTPEPDVPLDAIPLALLGCHSATIALLRTVGTLRYAPFRRGPRVEFVRPGTRPVRLRRPWAPAPLHAIVALATFNGLLARDRWQFLMLLERAWEGESLPADLELRTAEDWLAASGQSPMARAQFWNPLTHFLLGEDLAVVSAGALIAALSRMFLSDRSASRIALPEVAARRLLIQPVEDQLRRTGGTIRLGTAAAQFRFDQKQVSGVELKTGEVMTADWYIAALPPSALTPLLPERVLTHFSYFHQILKLAESPAVTVHLRFDPGSAGVSRTLRRRLFLLAARPFHWMVVRPGVEEKRQALVSLVSTGRFDLLDLTDQALQDCALAELTSLVPALTGVKVLGAEIVREPRAFLSIRPGTAALRPLQQSPFPNLLLAGDWTDTGWPATLESAILSGDRCADAIAAQSRS